MGYKKIITYTLKAESGCSLRAVGARIDGDVKGGSWSRSGRRRDEQVVFKQDKIRWELPFDSKLQGVKEKKQ
jgi:hypothetical protein